MPRARIAQLAGALVLALACALSAPSAVRSAAAHACRPGYAYAGLYATKAVAGVAASLTMLQQPTLDGGHVAAWVGIGGPGLGPHGTDEWLQVGIASFDGPQGRLYYELALPGKKPKFVQLADGIQPGQVVRVAVLELPFHPNDWVVITPQGIAGPFHLPGSHGRWGPVATGESWAKASGFCNTYDYRFGAVESAANGDWHQLAHTQKLQDPGWVVQRESGSSFRAAAIGISSS
jgi:hypothetical protein